MLPNELDKSGIVNNDYKDVVFGRRSVRALDPNFKIKREEILQMLQEAIVSSPSAVDTQPFYFLVIDTDEGKAKINDIMWLVDKDRCTRSSFTVIPCADAKWFEHYDELIKREKEAAPEVWPPEMEAMMMPVVQNWVGLLCANNGELLHKSVDFQAGLVTMAFLNAVRAHGYEAGFMDAWDPDMLQDAFGLDIERYRPQGVIAVGRKISLEDAANADGAAGAVWMVAPERYRYPAADLTMFA